MKAVRLVFAIVFILICCIPVYTMPLFADNSSAEKKQDAEAPSIIVDGGFNWEYPTLFDNYLSDHFAFRTPAVTLAGLLKAELGTSAQDKVVVGKEDWLFFAETLDDYLGKNTLSDYDISRLAKTLSLINEYVENAGGKFLFTSAPNKNSVYGEYMPYYYLESSNPSNLERLTSVLGGEDYYLDLLSVLKNSKDKGLLYHKRDSHWNNLGASIAFGAICEKLGISGTDYSNMNYKIESSWRGDLDDMIFPSLSIMDEQVIFNKEYTFKYGPKYKAVDDLLISATNKNREGSLYVFRDSFYNSLLPFFAEEFENSEFSRVMPYRISANVKEGDTVIVEIAERNLKNILLEAPVMTAPERDAANAQKIETEAVTAEKSGKYFHVYGLVSDDIDATKLLIGVTVDNNTTYYEPFPICESELLGENGNGFSLYLDSLPEDAQISVYTVK